MAGLQHNGKDNTQNNNSASRLLESHNNEPERYPMHLRKNSNNVQLPYASTNSSNVSTPREERSGLSETKVDVNDYV